MQRQLPSDLLFVEGRSFQHSIIVSFNGFQGSAQSYKRTSSRGLSFNDTKQRHGESYHRQILRRIACGIMSYFSFDRISKKLRVQAHF